MDIILIPGLWLDGSSWDAVVPVLENAGLRTHPLTLPGMQSMNADRSEITLRDHVAAVVEVIDSCSPTGQVVLVGHSGGGAIAHAAVDARPDRVARVVYVDAGPVGDGGVINDEFPADRGEVPLPDWSLFDEEDLVDLDDDRRTEFRDRAIPSPVHVARDPQQLSDERRYEVPITVIACEFPSSMLRGWIEDGHPYVLELSKIRDVDYVDLLTGHWPQFTRPEDLGQAILAAVGPDWSVRTQYAERQLAVVLTPRLLQLRRMVIGEVRRFPKLAKGSVRERTERAMSALAVVFGRVADAGLLELDDPSAAASHFNWLIMSEPLNKAMLLGDGAIPNEAKLPAHATDGVRVFLAAYGTH